MSSRHLWYVLDNIYYVEDGIICRRALNPSRPVFTSDAMDAAEKEFLAELAEYGYHPQTVHMTAFLDPLIGKTWDDLVTTAKKRGSKNTRQRKIVAEKNAAKRWENLRTQFNNNILGIDKKYINVHPTGFSIRVLMKTAPLEKRKKFVQENRDSILTWCIEELADTPAVLNRIGKPEYYTPIEITVLKSNELEVFFEVKTESSTEQ